MSIFETIKIFIFYLCLNKAIMKNESRSSYSTHGCFQPHSHANHIAFIENHWMQGAEQFMEIDFVL